MRARGEVVILWQNQQGDFVERRRVIDPTTPKDHHLRVFRNLSQCENAWGRSLNNFVFYDAAQEAAKATRSDRYKVKGRMEQGQTVSYGKMTWNFKDDNSSDSIIYIGDSDKGTRLTTVNVF